MSRTTRPRRRVVAALLSAAVAAVVTVAGTPAAQAEPFRTPWGTHDVRGAILGTYRALGGPGGYLGPPVSSELGTPDRIGRFNQFQRGAIYWSPSTGAHGIWGTNWSWYCLLGWEAGVLGYPTTSELITPDGRGRFNGFQNGAIYSRPGFSGPKAVYGAIYARYASLGWEAGPLGYPLSDELATPDRYGRFSSFQNGIIYWTPRTGAHHVRGAIRSAYAAQGYETGRLGYPLTDELATPARLGRYNHFEGGSIYWAPQTGSHAIAGDFREVWASMGWENSELGFPMSGEYALHDNRVAQDFEFGWIERYADGSVDVYLDE